MTASALALEHRLDAPAVVVWDSLTDPELVSGWLGEARIEPRVGGGFRLAWVGDVSGPSMDGEIVELTAPRRLTVSSAEVSLVFELESREGGLRGTWTMLLLTVAMAEGVTRPGLTELGWRRALGQLDELLRGHPVDWYAGRSTTTTTTAPRRDADLG